MQNNKSKSTAMIIAAVLLVLVGIGAVAYAFSQSSNDDKTTQTETKTSQSTEQKESPNQTTDQEQATSTSPTIVFTDDGFEQDTYTFPAGTAISVVNRSSMDMQFSSADHPTHRENPELNMAVLGAGESGTFTPPGKGTYGFHDHINDQFEGTLIIE